MTVEFVPARSLLSDAPRKRLSLPGDHATLRARVVLLACTIVACTTTACGDRADDARVALTTRASRELAQTQPTASPNPAQDTAPLATTFAAASGPSSPNSAEGANGAAAFAARAVRSPARPGAADGDHAASDVATNAATNADDAPLATPVIHTAD